MCLNCAFFTTYSNLAKKGLKWNYLQCCFEEDINFFINDVVFVIVTSQLWPNIGITLVTSWHSPRAAVSRKQVLKSQLLHVITIYTTLVFYNMLHDYCQGVPKMPAAMF